MTKGVSWDNAVSRRPAMLFIALCMAIVLFVAFTLPGLQATDSAGSADSVGAETVAYSISFYDGGYYGGYSDYITGASWS